MDKVKQKEFNNLLSSILKNNKTKVEIKEFELKENIQNEISFVSFKICIEEFENNKEFTCSSEGRGFVDAIWNALKCCLGQEYKTILDLQFKKFSIETLEGKQVSLTDGKAIAKLEILNPRNKTFSFQGNNLFSINSAAIETIEQALSFFINCEKAVSIIEKCIKDAKNRGRTDLDVRFTLELATLVEVTDYSKIIGNTRG